MTKAAIARRNEKISLGMKALWRRRRKAARALEAAAVAKKKTRR
jgi:hypothetical protein